TKKTAKRKRQLDMGRMVAKADQKAVMAMLPYA
ncbi:MAG: 50S ribosomal protein L35, partial [Geothrix sp.]|nr:50S ribosomal protein L35 [Geothrix sp.]